jgi:PhzF family phenazine biosynthesis protein
MPAPIPYYTVNAFAPTPHGGNPAAVVLFDRDDPRSTNEGYMSAVAADFHLPMTAFLTPVEKEKETFAIRWFTPSGYVRLI